MFIYPAQSHYFAKMSAKQGKEDVLLQDFLRNNNSQYHLLVLARSARGRPISSSSCTVRGGAAAVVGPAPSSRA